MTLCKPKRQSPRRENFRFFAKPKNAVAVVAARKFSARKPQACGKYSRWMSADPAVGDYIPASSEQAKKLPANGVYSLANLNLYHYGANNPLKYKDPTGMTTEELTDEQWDKVSKDRGKAVSELNDLKSELNDYSNGKGELSDKTKNAIKTYMGRDVSDKKQAAKIAKKIGKISDKLASMERKDFKFDNKTNSFAKANPLTGKMTLGKKYFGASDSGNDTRSGILIHEGAHLSWQAGDLPPSPYGISNAKDRMFQLKPDNADNIEYMYEAIFTGGNSEPSDSIEIPWRFW